MMIKTNGGLNPGRASTPNDMIKTHGIRGVGMIEIIFLVEEATDGGYVACARRESIITEADDIESLHRQVRDAVNCHLDEGASPKLIRLQFVRERSYPSMNRRRAL
jgi:hypothetical protein